MARWLYCLVLYLASPLIWARLFLRSRKQSAYLQHLGERWGFYGDRAEHERLIWVHAVSVGETRAAEPLIDSLRQCFPNHQILLTSMTPTGRDTGAEVFGGRVIQAYLPYDFPGATKRFLRHFCPEVGILMETEIWPNLINRARSTGIPVFLVNARLSGRSARGYLRFSALTRPAFSALRAVAAQTPEDALRLGECGAANVQVCGNLKFDVTPPAEKISQGKTWKSTTGDRLVWLAASTREGEERLVLDAYSALKDTNVLLVLVPRHPQRFEEVAALLAQRGLNFTRRSEAMPSLETQVWLGNSMGEMPCYFAMADWALIGGSLLPLGGQNLIEAAACGCPVLVGPHTFNFAQATRDSVAAGAALQLQSSEALGRAALALAHDPQKRAKMQQAAESFSAAHRGASQRTLSLIASAWTPADR